MADPTAPPPKPDPTGATPSPPPRRSPGHRGQDIRDTVAEMAAKAQEISMEAGSKMAAAMKDVIGAAAGISAFAIESARDLVQYMVRRGQMTQDEADKLIREVEEAQAKRGGRRAAAPAAARPSAAKKTAGKPGTSKAAKKPAAAKRSAAKPAAKKAAAKKSAAKKPAAKKPAAKKPAAKKPAAKKPAAKAGARRSAKRR